MNEPRNQMLGSILDIDMLGSIALIDVGVGGRRFTTSVISNVDELADWKIGQQVQLRFNEMEMAIAKNLSGQISLRNRFPGIITGLEPGKILTRVLFYMDGIALSAVITSRSAAALTLALGDQIEGLVKSNEMQLFAHERI
ncbi:MAG: TOBE domain-containing protein [Undibacterium sp.]|nr:TOBE domain-containing protein [Undibacterium sp.]